MDPGMAGDGEVGTADVLLDIVLPTRNRPDDLARALHSIAGQRHENFRAIVMDQSDDVAANAAVFDALDDDRFVHVPVDSRGKSKALNHALRDLSSADVVVFTDDDCEVEPDWLDTALASVRRYPDAAIIFGQLHAVEHDEAAAFVPSIEFDTPRVFDRLWRSHGLLGMGANMIIPRATFEEVGLFDIDLGPGGRLITGEEVELMYRCLDRRMAIVQDPSVHVVHWGIRSKSDGVADAVISEGFYAAMAGHGKHLRQGRWSAAPIVLHEIGWLVWTILGQVVRRRRPFHIRRMGVLLRGLRDGFRAGPAWPPLNRPGG